MAEDNLPQDIVFWLQQARELMMAAERCWLADETFKQQIAEGGVQLPGDQQLQMRIDAEVELNWLYNILASLSLYYIAIGILLHRDQQLLDQAEQYRILDLVQACGVEPDDTQRHFLQRVETALSLADSKGPWKIALDPQQQKLMNQKFSQQDTISAADKQAVDALFSKIIGVALREVGGEPSQTSDT